MDLSPTNFKTICSLIMSEQMRMQKAGMNGKEAHTLAVQLVAENLEPPTSAEALLQWRSQEMRRAAQSAKGERVAGAQIALPEPITEVKPVAVDPMSAILTQLAALTAQVQAMQTVAPTNDEPEELVVEVTPAVNGTPKRVGNGKRHLLNLHYVFVSEKPPRGYEVRMHAKGHRGSASVTIKVMDDLADAKRLTERVNAAMEELHRGILAGLWTLPVDPSES